MDKRRQVILLVLILVFVVLTISRCAPDLPDEFPEPERGEVDSLPPAQQRPEMTIGPDESLVEGQIMLTGASGNVQQLVETVRTLEGLELRPLVSTTFTFLDEFPPPESGDTDIRQQPLGKRQRAGDPLVGRLQDDMSSLQIAIYDYPEESYTITETLQLIAGVALSLDGPVVAEPNYVTGFEITGSPWGVEGSPWGVEGSPWGVEGSAGSGSDPDPDVKIASDEFWEQWALGDSPGINLLSSPDPLDGRKIKTRGRDVEVAVFDTSPFDGPGQYTFTNWGPDNSIDPLTVSVLHPLTLPQSATDTENDATRGDISDHGLFVSGLVYAVAPESEVRLIRVLNDQGQGEVQGLIDALSIYMLDRLGSNGGTLENTVINLSLGTHTPDDEELSDEAQAQIALMLERLDYRISEDEPLPVYALDVIMNLFERYGATVIAASGNHSAEEARALPPQYPAAVSTVRGVSASSKTPDQSCYANDGNLMAPGGNGGNGDADGDGVYDATPTDGNSCVPSHMTCSGDGPECGYGVVSYTQKGHRGFAYWVGTSFATPLVSGLAANVIEAGDGLPEDLRPGGVRAVLDCSAEVNGVVDVLEALNRCLPSP